MSFEHADEAQCLFYPVINVSKAYLVAWHSPFWSHSPVFVEWIGNNGPRTCHARLRLPSWKLPQFYDFCSVLLFALTFSSCCWIQMECLSRDAVYIHNSYCTRVDGLLLRVVKSQALWSDNLYINLLTYADLFFCFSYWSSNLHVFDFVFTFTKLQM